MKYIKKGDNKIFINTSRFGLNPDIKVSIYSNMTNETKTFTPKVSESNERYFAFIVVLVEREDEDLQNSKIFLIPGQHRITIKSKEIEYLDLMYVEGDVLNDRKYNPEKTSRVYKKSFVLNNKKESKL
jgi:hypothetical protein